MPAKDLCCSAIPGTGMLRMLSGLAIKQMKEKRNWQSSSIREKGSADNE